MTAKKIKYLILTLIVIGVLTLLIFLLFSGESKEIRRFEEEFSLNLPDNAEVVFSEDTHGAMGDGASLYIYQLDKEEMSRFLNQSNIANWSYLPLESQLFIKLSDIIKGVSGERIAVSLDLGSQKGYCLIKNRYNLPLKFYDFQDISFNNVIIGKIDLDSNKIFYFTWDT